MNNHWSYVEDSLQIRINAHNKYAMYDIDDWIVEKINFRGDEKILDLCCGNGKQSLRYAKILSGKGSVDAMDISAELLNEAVKIAESENIKISYHCRDINQKLPFLENTFDIVTCAFGIYYVQDIREVLSEIFRVLKPGGKFFVAGPTVNNAREMLDIYEEVTRQKISQKREKRMDSEIIPEIKKKFNSVEVEIFKNPINFPSMEEFIKYTCATLSFKENTDENIREKLVQKFKEKASENMNSSGGFTLTKEVYGILAHK
ncbi:MAG: methyltransferase domain-containing protein [Methanomicrobiaceae archaeon]|nr:methyltransferase domain-containing protein [Methanomicrobiaceae archaeon]